MTGYKNAVNWMHSIWKLSKHNKFNYTGENADFSNCYKLFDYNFKIESIENESSICYMNREMATQLLQDQVLFSGAREQSRPIN
jgi:hypothetical protein